MKYDLENAIAQMKKYKRKLEKARGAKKMLFKAHLAFWKSIRDELKDQDQNPQANDYEAGACKPEPTTPSPPYSESDCESECQCQ